MTVGAPGNRAALPSERFYSFTGAYPNLGAVNYAYRISRTETTCRQWIDFLNVAWPFADQLGYSRNDDRFTGGITASNLDPGTQPGWYYLPPFDQVAVKPSLRFAAWYCDWLQNGRPTTNITMQTFTTGAYNAAFIRQPGAKYWIPSLDEWTKATYYDPNRYGPGQGGYWRYSGMSDVPLVGGPPGTPGAQTSGGGWWGGSGLPVPPVGSYPQTISAWGLLDTSGGKQELTDTLGWFGVPNERVLRGQGLEGSSSQDRIDTIFITGSPDGGDGALRLASLVPSPGFCIVPSACCGWFLRRRRRRM